MGGGRWAVGGDGKVTADYTSFKLTGLPPSF